MIQDDNFIYLLAVRVIALGLMRSHFCDYFISFLFNKIDVFLLRGFVLLPLEFIFDFLHGVMCQSMKLLVYLFLYVTIIVFGLHFLIHLLTLVFLHIL